MSINLDDLSMKELKELHGQVTKAISGFVDRTRKAALAEMEETARKFGFSMHELTGTAPVKKRGAVAPKYANPADRSQTWSGRGRRPRWVDAALKAGKSLDDLSI